MAAVTLATDHLEMSFDTTKFTTGTANQSNEFGVFNDNNDPTLGPKLNGVPLVDFAWGFLKANTVARTSALRSGRADLAFTYTNTELTRTAFSIDTNAQTLTYTLSNGAIIVIGYEVKEKYVLFTINSVTGTVHELQFRIRRFQDTTTSGSNLYPDTFQGFTVEQHAMDSLFTFDDGSVYRLGLMGSKMSTITQQSDPYCRVALFAENNVNMGGLTPALLAGQKFVVYACLEDDFPAVMADIETDLGLYGGISTKQDVVNKGGVLFAYEISNSNVQAHIDAAKAAGCSMVMFLADRWYKDLSSTLLSDAWSSFAEMNAAVATIKAAGLRVGAHVNIGRTQIRSGATSTGNALLLSPNDISEFSYAYPDQWQSASVTTLSGDINNSVGSIGVTDPRDLMQNFQYEAATTAGAMFKVAQCGAELITFTGITRNSANSYTLTGCTRGAYGTPAAGHTSGDRINFLLGDTEGNSGTDYLQFRANTSLFGSWCASLASIYKNAGFEFLYFDGLPPYNLDQNTYLSGSTGDSYSHAHIGIGYYAEIMLTKIAVAGGSCTVLGHSGELYQTWGQAARNGQSDYNHGVTVAENVDYALSVSNFAEGKHNLCIPDLGWWNIKDQQQAVNWTGDIRDADYVGSRMLANLGSVTIAWFDDGYSDVVFMPAILAGIKRWLDASLAGAFSDGTPISEFDQSSLTVGTWMMLWDGQFWLPHRVTDVSTVDAYILVANDNPLLGVAWPKSETATIEVNAGSLAAIRFDRVPLNVTLDNGASFDIDNVSFFFNPVTSGRNRPPRKGENKYLPKKLPPTRQRHW